MYTLHINRIRRMAIEAFKILYKMSQKMSQSLTKPTIRLVRPAKTDQPAHSLIAWAFYSLQAIQKRDKREPLPYWTDVQADLSLYWSYWSYCRFCRALAQIFI